jgi:hypothetical protein
MRPDATSRRDCCDPAPHFQPVVRISETAYVPQRARGGGPLVGCGRFRSFGAPARVDQVLEPARWRNMNPPFRRPLFMHQRADQASHRPSTHWAGRTGPEGNHRPSSAPLNCVAQGVNGQGTRSYGARNRAYQQLSKPNVETAGYEGAATSGRLRRR